METLSAEDGGAVLFAVVAGGDAEEVATDYLPYGCGEYVLYKKSIATPSGVMNALKVLETARKK